MFLETARGKGRRGLAVATLPLRSLFSQSPFQSGQLFLGLAQLSGVLGGVGFRALTVRVSLMVTCLRTVSSGRACSRSAGRGRPGPGRNAFGCLSWVPGATLWGSVVQIHT